MRPMGEKHIKTMTIPDFLTIARVARHILSSARLKNNSIDFQ